MRNECKYNVALLTKTNVTYSRFKIKPYKSKASKNQEFEKGERRNEQESEIWEAHGTEK